MNKISVKTICMVAMLAAVICVLSIITIPTPWGVPFTLQTFAVALSGFVLGKKHGAMTAILYVLLGAVGLPVYAGMGAGLGVLFGKSGGYIFGFIFLSFFCGLGMEVGKGKAQFVISLVIGIIGLVICHVLGVIMLKFVLNCTWGQAVLWGTAPYVIKDILSLAAALLVSKIIRSALMRANLIK